VVRLLRDSTASNGSHWSHRAGGGQSELEIVRAVVLRHHEMQRFGRKGTKALEVEEEEEEGVEAVHAVPRDRKSKMVEAARERALLSTTEMAARCFEDRDGCQREGVERRVVAMAVGDP
jgi:hypothetical protein